MNTSRRFSEFVTQFPFVDTIPADIVARIRTIKPNELARRFSFVLSEWLSAEELAEINQRNSNENADTGACATHDFCDANQAMLDALTHFGIVEFWGDERLIGLINAAWDIAKKAGFAVTMIDS